MTRTLRRPLVAVSVAAIALLASACEGLSTPPAPGEAINACVAVATGNVRFIDPASGPCKPGETAMQLQQGGQSEPGPETIATSTLSATVPDGSAQTMLQLSLPAGTDFYGLSASAWTLSGLDPVCELVADAVPYGDMELIDRAGQEVSPSPVARVTTMIQLNNSENRTVALVCTASQPNVEVRASLTATPLDHQ